MNGNFVFKHAVTRFQEVIFEALQKNKVDKEQIDMLIPHQANLRIIQSLAKNLHVDMSKVEVNIQKYGNTSAATIPVALTEAIEEGRVKPNSHILLAAFGAGLTRAAGLVRWGERVTPLSQSDAQLPPCEQSAMEILSAAIRDTL